MNMLDWAKREVEIACKKENPDWDGKSFDYGCSCYVSALKAYELLSNDSHSGYSWSITRNILMRLMKAKPLTAITDDDFPECIDDIGNGIQCPRMSSLFKYLNDDGTLRKYRDIDRAVCIDSERHDDRYFSSEADIVDEMFPITMPYYPEEKPYEIYIKTFLSDASNGDYDTRCIEYIITPNGDRITINKCYGEKFGEMVEISEDEYLERLARRVDPLNKKAARHLFWTVTSNSGSESEIERKENIANSLDEGVTARIMERLEELCKVFEEHVELDLFNFHNMQSIAHGTNMIPELQPLQEFVQMELINGIFRNEQ